MDKLWYFLALVLVVAALIGLVILMQKLQARKVRYWNEKRNYEMKLAEQLQEEIQKSREG
ncbi:MAG: hypothetical protein GX849_00755 [Clostridiaceae bacterium]|jgi:hypothetical protein|nr:hypothetical protein [Clostridiaceae bacterium]